MRKWLWIGMLVAVAGLAALAGTSSAANATSCSNETLNGEYAFGVTLYTPPPTHVVEGVKFFDGQGGFTQFDYEGGTLPAVFRPPAGGTETGTYTVDPQGFPDCTGTLTIREDFPGAPEVEIDTLIVISDGGRHIHEVVSQLKVGGVTQPQPEVSADDWKVESAQNAQ